MQMTGKASHLRGEKKKINRRPAGKGAIMYRRNRTRNKGGGVSKARPVGEKKNENPGVPGPEAGNLLGLRLLEVARDTRPPPVKGKKEGGGLSTREDQVSGQRIEKNGKKRENSWVKRRWVAVQRTCPFEKTRGG